MEGAFFYNLANENAIFMLRGAPRDMRVFTAA